MAYSTPRGKEKTSLFVRRGLEFRLPPVAKNQRQTQVNTLQLVSQAVGELKEFDVNTISLHVKRDVRNVRSVLIQLEREGKVTARWQQAGSKRFKVFRQRVVA